MLEKADAIIFAPSPPQPPGGIGSIVAILYQSLGHRDDVCFVSPVAKKNSLLINILRPMKNIFRLAKTIGQVKNGGRVLFFCSSGGSFFEKLIWTSVVILSARKPIIVMVDGGFPVFWSKYSPVLKKLSSLILSNQQFVLAAQSEGWQNYYQSILPSSCIKMVGATVAEEFFNHTRQVNFPLRHVTILYVGWIIPEKGVFDLLDAMAILRKEHPEARLRLVGPLFGKEDYWNSAVVDRGISTQVEYLGAFSDRQSLIHEFDKSSIFVLPSHFEGFPVALLEAITMGLACVGTSVGGVPDILNHGKAGIVVAPKAPIELAKAMKVLLEDNDLVEDLSKQASIRARNVYSLHECVESYKNLLGLRG
jgi:glycosyltransferase involved in cell wall biosynthesis